MIGCSNNHMSHVEVGQTKVSLPMLLKVAFVLEKDINYFLLDTPYASKSCIINSEIAEKLDQCKTQFNIFLINDLCSFRWAEIFY